MWRKGCFFRSWILDLVLFGVMLLIDCRSDLGFPIMITWCISKQSSIRRRGQRGMPLPNKSIYIGQVYSRIMLYIAVVPVLLSVTVS